MCLFFLFRYFVPGNTSLRDSLSLLLSEFAKITEELNIFGVEKGPSRHATSFFKYFLSSLCKILNQCLQKWQNGLKFLGSTEYFAQVKWLQKLIIKSECIAFSTDDLLWGNIVIWGRNCICSYLFYSRTISCF